MEHGEGGGWAEGLGEKRAIYNTHTGNAYLFSSVGELYTEESHDLIYIFKWLLENALQGSKSRSKSTS